MGAHVEVKYTCLEHLAGRVVRSVSFAEVGLEKLPENRFRDAFGDMLPVFERHLKGQGANCDDVGSGGRRQRRSILNVADWPTLFVVVRISSLKAHVPLLRLQARLFPYSTARSKC